MKKLIRISFIVLIVGSYVGYNGFKYWTSTLPQRYTIGILSNIDKPAKGDLMAEWFIVVDGKKHLGIGDFKDIGREGDRFIVRFPIDYPSKSKMYFEYPVPDSLVAPSNGWSLSELKKIVRDFNP